MEPGCALTLWAGRFYGRDVKRLVIMGPPASGKGTQGPRLAAELGVPHLSSGHLLRRSIDRGDPFGVRPYVLAGEKVPDPIVEALLVPRLGPGFVLDGYPRSVAQAARLDEILESEGHPLDAALELELAEEILVVRMVLRAGAEKRSDDRPEVFLRRLEMYSRDAKELRDFYDGRLVRVDGAGEPSEIYERIRAALGIT
jgi:adenylate kinase